MGAPSNSFWHLLVPRRRPRKEPCCLTFAREERHALRPCCLRTKSWEPVSNDWADYAKKGRLLHEQPTEAMVKHLAF